MACARPFLPSAERTVLRRCAPYDDWLAANILTSAGREDLAAELSRNSRDLPKISVIMPVYRPDIAQLRAACDSVAHQTYAQWELCLADDGSDDPLVAAVLHEVTTVDPRVRYVARAANGGISAATNTAASLATGDVLVFMDQDDLLSPDALGEIALAFTVDPQLDLAFSDNDKLDARGCRTSPAFKPGWSPWLLLSYMYIGHAMAMRRSLFEQLGGMRSDFDGSQDYDLALRAAEKSRRVKHLPRMLYHWRVQPGSTAFRADEKPGSIEAGRRAVEEAVARRGITASIGRPGWARVAGIGLFDLQFPPPPSCSVIILTQGAGGPDVKWLAEFCGSLPDWADVIYVGAGYPGAPGTNSAGRTVRTASVSADVSLSRRLAAGVDHACGDAIAVIMQGLQPVSPDWLERLCGLALADGAKLVGPRLLDGEGKLFSAGLVRSGPDGQFEMAFAGLEGHRPGVQYLARTTRECLAVPGFCFAASRQLLQSLDLSQMDINDPVSLGIMLSNQVIRSERTVLVCGSSDVRLAVPAHTPIPASVGAGQSDPWYHPLLSSGHRQFLPASRSPGLRSPRPVRLAAVTHNLDQEGAQTVLVDLLCGMMEAGIARPFVITGRDGPMRAHLEAAGIEVVECVAPTRRAGKRALADHREALARSFQVMGAEAVFANTLECHGAVAAADRAGLGAIWWQHEGGSWQRYLRTLPWHRRAALLAAYQRATRVVTVAEATHRAWRDLALRDNQEVIRHAIPPTWIDADVVRWSTDEARMAARAELGLAPDECCVLLMGSISARKSQGEALAAFVAMEASAQAKLRVIIAGAFVDRSYHRKIAGTLEGLPADIAARVRLEGAVNDPEKYYAAADVFLCCSRQESAPRAMMEAMAFGLPIVTTPVDGIPELVESEISASFYRPADTRELARILTELCSSRSERERLGNAARVRFAKLNDHAGMIERFGVLIREAAWRSRTGLAQAADGS